MTYLQVLLGPAAAQRGFVTPQNARDLGVPPVELAKMAARGGMEHRSYGLYRVAGFPSMPGDELMEAVLWAGGGIISHEAALAHWELADVNPRRIDITVERRVRRTGGDRYRLWIAQVPPADADEYLGIPVTSPARTIRDAAAAGTDPALIDQAIGNGVSRQLLGLRDRKQLVDQQRAQRVGG